VPTRHHSRTRDDRGKKDQRSPSGHRCQREEGALAKLAEIHLELAETERMLDAGL
jgi:hypothetical protein